VVVDVGGFFKAEPNRLRTSSRINGKAMLVRAIVNNVLTECCSHTSFAAAYIYPQNFASFDRRTLGLSDYCLHFTNR